MGQTVIKQDNKLKSRLGFILLAAGSAIGLGNIWKFPYVAGENGGGAFLIIYLFFLILFGVPLLTTEIALGRRAQRAPTNMYKEIDPKKGKWFNWQGKMSLVGIILICISYVSVTAWIIIYFVKMCDGSVMSPNVEVLDNEFVETITCWWKPLIGVAILVGAGFIVCVLGVSKSLEKVTKVIMLLLFALIIVLTINSLCLPNSVEGLKFLFVPDFNRIKEVGIFTVIGNALTQVFYSLGIASGAMALMGSMTNKKKKLLGDVITIVSLDTFVALCSGIIVFGACFAYGIDPASGPELIFIAMPQVFSHMPLGQLWGALFFIFVALASFSSILSIIQTIISSLDDMNRKGTKINAIIAALIVLGAGILGAFSYNILNFIHIGDSNLFDISDKIVGFIILPLGGLTIAIFCYWKIGWGFDGFIEETNTGQGLLFPKWSKWYMKIVMPLLLGFVIVFSIVSYFVSR